MKFDVAQMPELLFNSYFLVVLLGGAFRGMIYCFIFCRSDMTKDQMVVDLANNSSILLWGSIILSSLSVGVLGYAAVRYTFLSTLQPKSLFTVTVKVG